MYVCLRARAVDLDLRFEFSIALLVVHVLITQLARAKNSGGWVPLLISAHPTAEVRVYTYDVWIPRIFMVR